MIYSEEYMIVLGAKLKNDRITSTLKHRLDMAAYYKQQHPETPIVVSGGISPGNTISEAQAMKEYLVKKYRIPEKSIIKEEKSRTTLENLKFCREILLRTGGSYWSQAIITCTGLKNMPLDRDFQRSNAFRQKRISGNFRKISAGKYWLFKRKAYRKTLRNPGLQGEGAFRLDNYTLCDKIFRVLD